MSTRRRFLATIGALAGVAVCRKQGASAGGTTGAANRERLERVGIQLYSVRREMQRDVPGTIARLAEIGYRELEFAGYFGRTPAQVREMLERNRITAPSTHVPIELLAGGWDKALDDAATIGHRYVTIPWIPVERRRTLDSWRQVAADFNRAAATARARGLSFAYHNHDFEFDRIENTIPFDVLLSETDPALVSFELDLYWITKAGHDPLAYIRRHPTRFSMVHIKDSAGAPQHTQTDVGAGTINFASIFRLDADQRRSIKHFFVEHDEPADPLAFAKKSFDHLSRLEF